MNNFIIKRLNLNKEDIESTETIASEDSDDIIIILKRKTHVCPHCSSETNSIKDYKLRKLNYKIFKDSKTTLFYKSRRYYCPHCGKSFVENNPFGKKKSQISNYVLVQILEDLKPYNSTFSSVARTYGLSVTTVMNLFDKHVQIERKPLPEIMCWDEFYFNRHAKYKYAFIIMDFKKKVITDILKSRKISFLDQYFLSIPETERNNVKYIITDMYPVYRTIAHDYFPKATLAVDPFHIIKLLNDIVNRTRKKVMGNYKKKKNSLEYRLLKRKYKLLLKDWQNIDRNHYFYDRTLKYHTTEEGVLNRMLEISPYLKTVYESVQLYYDFNRESENSCPSRDIKKGQLEIIIDEYTKSKYKDINDAANTLRNWKEEILNSFNWSKGRRLSNGPIEGKNNYIKKIISNANGYSNFERARNKFLYSQNQYEKYSLVEKEKPVKRTFKKRGPYCKKQKK